MSFRYGVDLVTHFASSGPIPGRTADLIKMGMGDNKFVQPCFENPVACSDRTKDYQDGYFTQDGHTVLKTVLNNVPARIDQAVEGAPLTSADIDRVILHPGSRRMLEALTEKLSGYRVYSEIKTGNKSSVSMLESLVGAIEQKFVGKGSRLVFGAFGAGSPHLFSSTVVAELK